MDKDWNAEYLLCASWNGDCSCWANRRDPCQSIQDAVENGETAATEKHRIAKACGKLHIQEDQS